MLPLKLYIILNGLFIPIHGLAKTFTKFNSKRKTFIKLQKNY